WRFASWRTISFTSCTLSLCATSTASLVSTTTVLSMPTSATSRDSACTKELLASCSSTSPLQTLQLVSCVPCSQTADHAPRSVQPAARGTTTANPVFSITAKSIELAGQLPKISTGMRQKSRSGLALCQACAQMLCISGSYLPSSCKYTAALNMNMPLFQ